MDAYQISLRRVRAALLLGTVGVALTGCGGRDQAVQQLRTKLKDELRDPTKKAGTQKIDVVGKGNVFLVEDAKGRKLVEAKVERIEGSLDSRVATGIEGPVRMKNAECRLYKNGRPELDLKAPEATWDGKKLVTPKTVHGKTADGELVLDAQTATWTAESGKLDLSTAKLQTFKKGKLDFTAEAPRAHVLGDDINMPAGSRGYNPEGSSLQAKTVRLNRKTGKLDARGDVQVRDPEMRATGQRLIADTRLKRGRMTGGTRIILNARRIAAKPASGG